MVHARNVKPPVAGATLVSVDESSVEDLPGFVRSCARATTSRSSASARSRRFKARESAEGEWRKPATAPFPASETSSRTCARTPAIAQPPACRQRGRGFAAREGRRGDYDMPFQGTPRLARRTRWPIRRTIS
jgi:hypothetical protein